jgi:hypothetical protein
VLHQSQPAAKEICTRTQPATELKSRGVSSTVPIAVAALHVRGDIVAPSPLWVSASSPLPQRHTSLPQPRQFSTTPLRGKPLGTDVIDLDPDSDHAPPPHASSDADIIDLESDSDEILDLASDSDESFEMDSASSFSPPWSDRGSDGPLFEADFAKMNSMPPSHPWRSHLHTQLGSKGQSCT